MRSRREVWVILALALVWVVGWTILHVIGPRAFPLVGVLFGLIIFVLVLAMKWFDWPK
jgi:hypothetical protein